MKKLKVKPLSHSRKFVVFGVLLLAVFFLLAYFPDEKPKPREMTYSAMVDAIQSNTVRQVIFSGSKILVEDVYHSVFLVTAINDDSLIEELIRHKISFRAEVPESPSILLQILVSWFPMMLLIGIWVYYVRKTQGSVFGFGKSKAKLIVEGDVSVRFDDVAGLDEAKSDVMEMVSFLKNPGIFAGLGGKIPRGALLVGPPGTGKTLLAKAIAGEAGVPFFSISGSDFVEMFVGVGASRVRDMFSQAKKMAPCIIFIDEIDAVGQMRSKSMAGGSGESDQTLNQLLVEMDGFEEGSGIIVIAATNRVDVLDTALLRPGRFDRQIYIGLPDVSGRSRILQVHSKNIPLASDVQLDFIARGTPGFSGADLANLMNESAILAARLGLQQVGMAQIEMAKDKILMGAERKTLAMSEQEKRMTAYHEAGHAIVGWFSPEHDPVYKVSIIPRGIALGVTTFLPEGDQHSVSKEKLHGCIATLFGGRAAEMLVMGPDKVTTGAQNDIERATEIAYNMVSKWGLSGMGQRYYTEKHRISNEQMLAIDQEVSDILTSGYERAVGILALNRESLDRIAEQLMLHETIDSSVLGKYLVESPPVNQP